MLRMSIINVDDVLPIPNVNAGQGGSAASRFTPGAKTTLSRSTKKMKPDLNFSTAGRDHFL
jgi:hypothetical protein